MTVLLLAGPPAVGHNTIAEAVCTLRPRCSIVDVDDLRSMVRAGWRAPWDGEEGNQQYELAIRNACTIAKNLDSAGFDVLLVDVVPPETLSLYRAQLNSARLHVVLLHAEADALVQRDIERNQDTDPDPAALKFWHDRIRFLRDQLVTDKQAYDFAFDTGQLTIVESAIELSALLD